jgi:hypothetical protein
VKETSLRTVVLKGRKGVAAFTALCFASRAALGLLWALANTAALQAGTVYVPNSSFESPSTVFVDTRIDSWQKSPKPFWFDEGTLGPWDQLSGVFLNTPPGDSRHIDNCEGSQAIFLFASPDVALFQDYNTVDGTNTTPSHAFNARFETGKTYTLTVGAIGGGGGMSNGATLQLSLYYRDAASNKVTVAAATITNTPAVFSNTTHFIDFQLRTPAVKTTDPWLGQNIGIELLSTVGFTQAGGYWDLDNARLTETIDVPNGSFESPGTVFVDTRIDSWQKSPKPFWFDEGTLGPWDQLSGVFLNTPPGDSRHIDNCEGSQAIFLFASPDVALFQDYNTVDGTNPAPSHAFNARFETGKSYTLTVGAIGGGGGMSNGATLQISLYYRDAASNKVAVAAATLTNTPVVFSNTTHFIDFQVRAPAVKASDAWAGKNVGIQLLSTAGFTQAGGYWDLDNVRLVERQEPVLAAPTLSNGRFQFTLRSEPGLKFEVSATTDPGQSVSNWVGVAVLTNTTGNATVTDTNTGLTRRFYGARQMP